MSCSESEALCYLAIGYYAVMTKKRKRPKVWVKSWIEKRQALSHTHLIQELAAEPLDYQNYLRMSEKSYNELLSLVTPLIQKQDTVMREAISPHERLTATIRYLAEGKNQTSLQYPTLISRQTLGRIIPETCRAIYGALKNEYMKFPGNIEEMKMIAKQFQNKWQFPNCLGSVDGKHVKIVPPPGAGSHFFNYKGFHSIVLMAIVDADYQFIFVDVGINGRVSDGGVLKKTEFYKRLNEGDLNIPPPEKPTQDSDPLPFVYIGDEAFALRPDILKPYPQRELSDHDKRIYNYRVCRARRIVENAFGILAARFQIFHSAINFQSVEDISFVLLACCTLHNYLCKSRRDYITPGDSDTENHITGTIQEGLSPGGILEPIQVTRTGNSSNNAKKVREDFVKYFNTSGVVPWQERMINS